MNWRLGLDLGTNSIGWCVLKLNEELEPCELVNLNSRIFSDGRDPKTKEPLAVARRTARGIRKNLYRKKLRRRQLFRILQENNLYPKSKQEASKLKSLNPYLLRIKALDTKLEPYELGRALFNLGVRRGFKSNRKDSPDEKVTSANINTETTTQKQETTDTSKMKQGEKCLHLAQAIEESNYRTLGEFLWNERENNHGIRFAPDRTSYYPLRKLYEDEFDLIRKNQEQYYPNIKWDIIKDKIFYQRPLKPQDRGKCQFMKDHERTFKAMPCSQKYRILQEVYNLMYYPFSQTPTKLTRDQQKTVIHELDIHKELSFNRIRKILKIEGHFNLESESRIKLNGNNTACILRNEKNFGDVWDNFSLHEQDSIVEKLITANEDIEVLDMLKKYDLSEEQKKSITRIVFPSGTTSLCKELTENLVKEMSEKHLQFDKALMLLGYEHYEETVEHFDLLPYYGQVLTGSTIGGSDDQNEKNPEIRYGKIGNPTVHVALNQTRVVVNALVKKYGKPTQIVVELSRDLKNSKKAKDKINKTIAENTKRNAIINKSITDMTPSMLYPNRQDRQKYRLWEELGANSTTRRCLYCGKVISASEIFSKNIEIEHILPYGRTLLNAESNLTVAHAHCNAFKGDRSPYEAFGSNPPGYNWNEILARVSELKNKTKQSRFSEKAMENFEKDSTFITRQLTDNMYLSKVARRYLTCLMDNPKDVWVIPGQMTKILRDKWHIDEILKRKIGQEEIINLGLKDDEIGKYKKNRYDHRHHALDAMVIGLVDRSLVQQIAKANRQRKTERLVVPQIPFTREEIVEKAKKAVVSFKPDHGLQGKLSKETLLGCIKIESIKSIKELKENDIQNIKLNKVREKFEELTAEFGFKKAKKTLQEEYPSIIVFDKKFVSRTPITSLKGQKNIDDIVDKKIQKQLSDFVALNANKKFDKIMQDFSQQTGIKKVRCLNHDQNPIDFPAIINGKESHRYYGSDSYVCVIVWQIPPKKMGGQPTYTGQFVRYDQITYDKSSKKQQLPNRDVSISPAAKKVCTLFKDDYLEFSQDGIWKKGTVKGFSGTQNKLDINPVNSVVDTETWLISTNEQMLEHGWKKQKGHYFISINVLFGEKSAHQITVSPIGEVHRKQPIA